MTNGSGLIMIMPSTVYQQTSVENKGLSRYVRQEPVKARARRENKAYKKPIKERESRNASEVRPLLHPHNQ